MVCRALAAVLLVAACSHPSKSPNGAGSGSGSSVAVPAPDAGSGETSPSDGEPAGPAPVTRADCEQLIDHVLEVGLIAIRARKKAAEVPTDEQVAKLRVKLQGEMMDICLTWDRGTHDCMMAAPTEPELYACAEPAPSP